MEKELLGDSIVIWFSRLSENLNKTFLEKSIENQLTQIRIWNLVFELHLNLQSLLKLPPENISNQIKLNIFISEKENSVNLVDDLSCFFFGSFLFLCRESSTITVSCFHTAPL